MNLASGRRPGAAEETRRSLASLRRVSSLPAAVVTDRPWEGDPCPDRFLIRTNAAGFAAKPRHMYEASPFEETLFIDSDTYVAADVTPVFGLLRHYDIGVRFGGPQLNEEDGLELHTQCNSGVILFRRSAAVEEVFALWNSEYDRALKELPPARDARGFGDQRFLAIAIAKSRARPVHLAEYLNFTLFDTLVTYSPPLVLHGRLPHMEAIEREISGRWDPASDWHPRLWLPNIRGLLPAGVRRSDPVLMAALVLRRLWNDTRRKLRLR